MPFVSVPKDLTKVKTKVAFNLTKRQLVCFGLGAVTGIPVYLLTRGSIGNDVAALLMIGLMLPFFAFGIYEKDGMPLEKVLGNFIRASFIRPHYRPYRTDNGYAALMRAERDSGLTGGSQENGNYKTVNAQGYYSNKSVNVQKDRNSGGLQGKSDSYAAVREEERIEKGKGKMVQGAIRNKKG